MEFLGGKSGSGMVGGSSSAAVYNDSSFRSQGTGAA